MSNRIKIWGCTLGCLLVSLGMNFLIHTNDWYREPPGAGTWVSPIGPSHFVNSLVWVFLSTLQGLALGILLAVHKPEENAHISYWTLPLN